MAKAMGLFRDSRAPSCSPSPGPMHRLNLQLYFHITRYILKRRREDTFWGVPELSMIRSCPNRLEFKNECYSTVNQSISKKNIDICINFRGRTKTKPFLNRKKVPNVYFHFWPPKKCPPFFFLIHTW
jgi:hypothetical protein